MTREETSACLTILKAAYPTFYNRMTQKDAVATLELWSVMFEQEDVGVVKFALYKLIEAHTGFPPDIAAVKAKIRELVSAATGEPTDEELWVKLKAAISNGYYGAREEFDKLPRVVQTYLGSPSALRDLSIGDTKTIDTVVHGQFLKQIGLIRERLKYADELPEAVRETVARLYGKIDDAPDKLTDGEWNDRRNELSRVLSDGTQRGERPT